jgi:hydrogenase maturation factor
MKETDAHNVPVMVDRTNLDVDKYKHLLKLSSQKEEVEVKAQKPSIHVPVEQEGIKLMSRVQEIHCPHCGEHVGRWTFFHRLAASEELDENKASELLEEKRELEERINSIEEVLANQDTIKKYESVYNDLEEKKE